MHLRTRLRRSYGGQARIEQCVSFSWQKLRARWWARARPRSRCKSRCGSSRGCRCCCGRRALSETEDLEHLVGHAGVLTVPSDAAGAVTVARVLPSRARVPLNSPIVPEPLTVCIEILPRLHRDPIGPGGQGERVPQVNHKIRGRSGIGPVEERDDQRSGKVARPICVKVNVER
jgi:hypothetical protein